MGKTTDEILEMADAVARALAEDHTVTLAGWIQGKIAEAVAAERGAIAGMCLEAGNTALANKHGEIAGALYVMVANIRARGDTE